MNNIFVGNLSFKATKEDVVKLFDPFGTVANVVVVEKKKGKSRGFGFVDMPNEEERSAAIAALQGKEFMWRVLSVSPVIPKVKSTVKSDHGPKSSRKGNRTPRVNKDFKASHKKDEGSRPYYGKKDGKFAGQSNLPKISKGFKMFHKVSGASNTRSNMGRTDGL